MADSHRQLVKNGEWQVQPSERPDNWRSLGVPRDPWAETVLVTTYVPAVIVPPFEWPWSAESVAVTALDIRRCACGRPLGHFGNCRWLAMRARIEERVRIESIIKAFKPCRKAIQAGAECFGADAEIKLAAEVLILGLWTRSVADIRVILNTSAPIERIARRYIAGRLWRPDGIVHLGPLDQAKHGELEFWLCSMVGAGKIGVSWNGKEPLFHSFGDHFRARTSKSR